MKVTQILQNKLYTSQKKLQNKGTDNNLVYSSEQNNNNNNIRLDYPESLTFGARVILDKRTRLNRAHGIIHSAATGAASAAAACAQCPGADTAALTAITVSMVTALCRVYDVSGGSTLGQSIMSVAVGKILGVDLAMKCISWIPGIGNAANAIVTFSLHEATGWAIVALLEEQRKHGKLDEHYEINKEMLEKYKKKAKAFKEENENSSQNISFKGDTKFSEYKIKKAKAIIKDFIHMVELDDNIEKNGSINQLTSDLCSIYNIDKDCKTAKNIKNLFTANAALIRLTNLSSDKEIKEQLHDNSFETVFWTIVAILENNKNEDLSNVDFSKTKLSEVSNIAFKYAIQ